VKTKHLSKKSKFLFDACIRRAKESGKTVQIMGIINGRYEAWVY
jgi:hypothetical protein